MSARIFRYRLKVDVGSAPNPAGGWCTLAICKPVIRRTAAEGDWIIGFRSKHANHVTYVMQIESAMSFSEYWQDTRFSTRKPHFTPLSDNIYEPKALGEYQQIPNRIHQEKNKVRDLGTDRVLIASRFWYFGANSQELPNHLRHLVHHGRGHAVNINRRPTDEATLQEWLKTFHPGVHGRPADLPADVAFAIENRIATVRLGPAGAAHSKPVLPLHNGAPS